MVIYRNRIMQGIFSREAVSVFPRNVLAGIGIVWDLVFVFPADESLVKIPKSFHFKIF